MTRLLRTAAIGVAVALMASSANAATLFTFTLTPDQEVGIGGDGQPNGDSTAAALGPNFEAGSGTAEILFDGSGAAIGLSYEITIAQEFTFGAALGGTGNFGTPIRELSTVVPAPSGNALTDIATVTRLHIHGQQEADGNGGAPGVNTGVAYGLLNPNSDVAGGTDAIATLNADGTTTLTGVWDLDEDQGQGSFGDFSADLLALTEGGAAQLYWNLHSVADPGGAARGQFIAANSVGSVDAPVPVPAALPMLVTALGGLGLLARRRRG